MDNIKVGIVEDQQLFREGITAIVDQWEDTRMMFESPNGYSVQERLENSSEIPDVMLVDISLPPNGNKEFSGLDVVYMLKRNFPEIKILMLSVHEEEYYIVKMIEAGADGYLTKESHPDEVHRAIVEVYKNGGYINSKSQLALEKHKSGELDIPKSSIINLNRIDNQ